MWTTRPQLFPRRVICEPLWLLVSVPPSRDRLYPRRKSPGDRAGSHPAPVPISSSMARRLPGYSLQDRGVKATPQLFCRISLPSVGIRGAIRKRRDLRFTPLPVWWNCEAKESRYRLRFFYDAFLARTTKPSYFAQKTSFCRSKEIFIEYAWSREIFIERIIGVLRNLYEKIFISMLRAIDLYLDVLKIRKSSVYS